MPIPEYLNLEALWNSLVKKPAAPAAAGPDVAAYETAAKPGAVPKGPGLASRFPRAAAVGGALARTGSVVSAAPSVAGAGMMAAAGGSAVEGADPLMFGRALGEGVARMMLPESTRQAADQLGVERGNIRSGATGPDGSALPAFPAPAAAVASGMATDARQFRPGTGLQSRPVAMDPATGYPVGTDPVVAQAAQSRQADAGPLTTLDRRVGRSDGTDAGVNARMRNIAGDPQAIGLLNEAQRLNRTGIMASRDANGRLSFTNDPNAQPMSYQGADGKPTRNWTDTEAYQSAIARNAADKAQLAEITEKRENEAGLGAVQKARTVVGKKVAADLYIAGLQNQAAGRQNLLARGIAVDKSQNDRAKLGIELMTALANNDAKAAEAVQKKIMAAGANMVAAGDERGAAIAAAAAGRTSTPSFAFDPTQITTSPGDPRNVLNQRTGAVTRVTPVQQATRADIQADMVKRGWTEAQVLAEYKRRGIDVSGLR